MIFAFVVRNFRCLAKAPGAPQIFDIALLLSTAFSPGRLRAFSAVEGRAQQLPKMSLGLDRFGGIGFFHRVKRWVTFMGTGCSIVLLGEGTGVGL